MSEERWANLVLCFALIAILTYCFGGICIRNLKVERGLEYCHKVESRHLLAGYRFVGKSDHIEIGMIREAFVRHGATESGKRVIKCSIVRVKDPGPYYRNAVIEIDGYKRAFNIDGNEEVMSLRTALAHWVIEVKEKR